MWIILLSSHHFGKKQIVIEITVLQIQGMVINTTSIPPILSFFLKKLKKTKTKVPSKLRNQRTLI